MARSPANAVSGSGLAVDGSERFRFPRCRSYGSLNVGRRRSNHLSELQLLRRSA